MPSAPSTAPAQTEARSASGLATGNGQNGSENTDDDNNVLHSSEIPTPSSSPSASPSSADHIVESLHQVDKKVETMRQHRLQDPDTLGDKIFKMIFPFTVGTVAGQLFKNLWEDRASGKRRAGDTAAAESAQQQGLIGSIVFAALSAALGAVISELSVRGSNALVTRRHNRRSRK